MATSTFTFSCCNVLSSSFWPSLSPLPFSFSGIVCVCVCLLLELVLSHLSIFRGVRSYVRVSTIMPNGWRADDEQH